MNPKIGVLMGGRSAEKEVSIRTGEAVYKALIKKGYIAERIHVDFNLVEELKAKNIELAFIALHGPFGEDGTVQGLLEMLDIPYTGSGVLASALAIDKVATKKMLKFEGIPTPNFTVWKKSQYEKSDSNTIVKEILSQHNLPVVIKAPTQGSTIGTSFVHKENELIPALLEAFKYDPVALVEEMIEGVELTAAVLGNEDPIALPLIEIYSVTGVFDYEAKYTKGLSEHIIPPRIPEEQQEQVKQLAIKTYQVIGCRGLARVDFIVDEKANPTVLEVNTIPGMTETSLFPDAARAAGIEFEVLVDKIVQLALEK